jgi:CDP-diacylglycerol--glycerol-3-phosphate 3-phosphatidyltransferase
VTVPESSRVSDRIWTIPNLLSFVRLLFVPVFFWLIVGPHADVAAVVVLVLSGLTDWLDGRLARRLGQISRLGQQLDPLADRLYTLAALIALALRDIVPWWFVVVLLARDVWMFVVIAALRRRGYGPVPVNLVGKAATVALLWCFPLLLLSAGDGAIATGCAVFGWAFALWGLGLYWLSAVLYTRQATVVLRAVAGRR